VDIKGDRKILFAGLYSLILIIVGTFGYMLIDDYSFIDAVYMTVITVSTVGFGEVQTLSNEGKLFTAFLILAGLGVIAYFITTISQNLFQNQLSFFYGAYNKRKGKAKMENHVVVVGFGRNGGQVVSELIDLGTDLIVVDESHEIVINNMGKPIRFIEGDATQDEVLIKADIKSAQALISTLPSDADNLFVVLTARSLNPDLKIISRASSESSEQKLRMAGVDSVVMPERVGGAHMATLVAKPDVVEFLEHLTIHSEQPTQLMEIMCKNVPADLINKPIKEMGIRRKSGANIVGFKTVSGEVIINPSPDTKLIPDSKLFVLGTAEQIQHMKDILEGGV
jgi:voltage-gated potassium channel